MDGLDWMELEILKRLVDNELHKIEEGEIKLSKQYEFDLRMLEHKLEVMKRGKR